MSLFNGVENFVPAFKGRELAIQSGQGAGQSISRGQQTAQRGKGMNLQKKQFDMQIKSMKSFENWLGGSNGDWAGETDNPASIY